MDTINTNSKAPDSVPFRRYVMHLVIVTLLGGSVGALLIHFAKKPKHVEITAFREYDAIGTLVAEHKKAMKDANFLNAAYSAGAGCVRAYYITEEHINDVLNSVSGADGIVIEMGYVPPAGGTSYGNFIPSYRPARYDATAGSVTIINRAVGGNSVPIYWRYAGDIGCPNNCADIHNLSN